MSKSTPVSLRIRPQLFEAGQRELVPDLNRERRVVPAGRLRDRGREV